MRITSFEWTENDINHIARHAVTPEEAEEVCFQGSPIILKAKYGRYIALGQAGGGRYLAVIFKYTGHQKAKVITARAMSETERRFYKRR